MDPLNEENFVPDYEEMLPADVPEPVSSSIPDVLEVQPSKSRKRSCSLCSAQVTTVKFHTLRYHLPWYFDPRLACSLCQISEKSFCYLRERHISVHPNFISMDAVVWIYLMCGFLTLLSKKLGFSNFLALVDVVVKQGLVPEFQNNHSYFNEDSEFLLRLFADEFDLGFSLSLHPVSSVVACLHWRVISSLLLKLSPSDREELRHSYVLSSPSGDVVSIE